MKPPDILALLIMHERSLSLFYEHCSKRFTEDAQLWQKLSQEEENHAKILEVLASQVTDGKAFVDELKFRIKAVESSLQYISDLNLKILGGKMTRLGALSSALDLEKASLDSSFFSIFKTDWKALAEQIEKVGKATCIHRDRLSKYLADIRKKG